MKIKDFEAAHSEVCSPASSLDLARNLFVVAENAALRPGPFVVVDTTDRAALLQRCFSGREVLARPNNAAPALLYLNTTDAQTLAEARSWFDAVPELICIAESYNVPPVRQLFDALKLEVQVLESNQVLVQKVGTNSPHCHWPWTEFTVHVDDTIGVCCGAGGLDRATPENAGTIWNAPGIRNVRQNLLRGEFKGICERCPFKTLYNQAVTGIGPRSDIPIFPKSMSLIITEKCNLKCWFCNYTTTYSGRNRIKAAPDISIELLEEIAPRFWKHLDAFNSNCGGEVFLYPHWNRIIELMRKYPPKASVSTSGGGIEVSEEDWSKILETHTHWMFSVDSFDPQTHWIMRGCDIGIVRRNVTKIRRLRDAHYPSRIYGFSCVLMKLTVPGLFNFVRTAVEEYGAGCVGFQHVIDNATQTCADEPQWRQLFNCELNKVRHYCSVNKIGMGHPMGYYLDNQKQPEGRRHFAYPDE
jgi:hypothetical protein